MSLNSPNDKAQLKMLKRLKHDIHELRNEECVSFETGYRNVYNYYYKYCLNYSKNKTNSTNSTTQKNPYSTNVKFLCDIIDHISLMSLDKIQSLRDIYMYALRVEKKAHPEEMYLEKSFQKLEERSKWIYRSVYHSTKPYLHRYLWDKIIDKLERV